MLPRGLKGWMQITYSRVLTWRWKANACSLLSTADSLVWLASAWLVGLLMLRH